MNLENVIIHCMKLSTWRERSGKAYWGCRNIEADGFIHCSSIKYFWRVAPNFRSVAEPMVLVLLDESKLTSEVKYEDGDDCGRTYPHIYGLINTDAVVGVLPFLRDEQGEFVKNPELAAVADE